VEASALSTAAQRGLLTRRSPLLKMKGDEQLIALVRSGNSGAFDVIVDRYQGRLLGFCRQMVGSTEDAEDVLQEVFVNAYKAMMADNREINLRPWLYRIARNRSLNHLRKPKADCQESMDMVPMVSAGSTAEKVQNREEFRQLLTDVSKLPETQRAALMLREIDAMSYEEIAEAMETTVPSVKSLLVRARISLAEASQARMLTCGEVKVELAEAAEGLTKVSGPVRKHVRDCEGCADFRKQLRSDSKVLAMIMPIGPILALKAAVAAKIGFGGAGTAGTAAGGAAGTAASGAAVGGAGVAGAAAGTAGAASGIGALTSAVGFKAVAGVVTAAVLTAGAVEVRRSITTGESEQTIASKAANKPGVKPAAGVPIADSPDGAPIVVMNVPVDPEVAPVVAEPAPAPVPAAPTDPVVEDGGVPVPQASAEGSSLEGSAVEIPPNSEPVAPPIEESTPVPPTDGGEVVTPAPIEPAPVEPAPVESSTAEPIAVAGS
jgi:RNA polymerase sigma factor (sigma-70 family)